MKKIFLIFFINFFSILSFGQTKYLIYFKDKGEQDKVYFKKSSIEKELYQLFTQKAIERRRRVLGEEIFLYGDYPIYPLYIQKLDSLGIQIINKLNWFNAVSCFLNDEQTELIKNLPFIEKIEPVRVFKSRNNETNSFVSFDLLKSQNNYGPSFAQLNLSDIPQVHSKGISGQNVIIGLLDSGFRWKSHEAIQNTNVIAEYDFVFRDSITANQPEDNPAQDVHGTMILGIVAGKMDGKLYGASYNSKFILAKTEDIRSERRVEEDNYAAALEWMERLGVDVTSSSLGYSEFDDPNESYTYRDMNGQTTIVARAVDSAFLRGVVTVTSAGNEYMSPWRYIVSPADAKYVLAVGAVNPDGSIASFSSRGPTSDGRIKPDVCAQGVSVYTVQTGSLSNYTYASGTSASAPIVAGIAALLISHYPDINQYQVRDAIRWTASQANKPDTVYGWGIASAKKAIEYPLILRIFNGYILNKTFITNEQIDSVRLIIQTDYSNEIIFNDRMQKSLNGIKFFSPNLALNLNSDDVYKFYFIYYKNGIKYREPEDEQQFYSLHLNSLKVFPPKKSLNQVTSFKLYQNYPNPFIERTRFQFELPSQDWVTIEIYDLLGRKVKTLVKDVGLSRGIHNWLEWDGTDDNGNLVSDGIYFYRFSSLQFNQTKKLILLRK
ncbi:MAG: S8 family serine peptidase [Ignavibacteria bacterium]|nr:S8 family serine peptidase [Ignavibacteria bacterium]